jgi:hypothetical protein
MAPQVHPPKTTKATTSWGSHVSRGILVTRASVRPGLMTPWTARNPGLLPLGAIKSRAPLTGRRPSPNDTTITLHFSTLPHTLPIVSTTHWSPVSTVPAQRTSTDTWATQCRRACAGRPERPSWRGSVPATSLPRRRLLPPRRDVWP